MVDEQPWESDEEVADPGSEVLPDAAEIAAADAALDELLASDPNDLAEFDASPVLSDEADHVEVGARPVERFEITNLDESAFDEDELEVIDVEVEVGEDEDATEDEASEVEDELETGVAEPTVSEPESLDPDQIDADLQAVDAAIERIDRGAYGRCEVCHVVLDDAVLQADPTVAACPAHIHLRSGSSADPAV